MAESETCLAWNSTFIFSNIEINFHTFLLPADPLHCPVLAHLSSIDFHTLFYTCLLQLSASIVLARNAQSLPIDMIGMFAALEFAASSVRDHWDVPPANLSTPHPSTDHPHDKLLKQRIHHHKLDDTTITIRITIQNDTTITVRNTMQNTVAKYFISCRINNCKATAAITCTAIMTLLSFTDSFWLDNTNDQVNSDI